jgi:predicted DCC family thiol-disulfide oxidoreductase YuxK
VKTLENKVIIYDDVCPMCNAYTAGFVRLGWLKNRLGFATTPTETLQKIDLDRARHEIPLLDTRTGEVVYGLDALFLILGARMPFLKPVLGSRFFRAPLYQLYQIITYNRRIIAGSRPADVGFDCAPDVNLFYRWLYIGVAIAAASLLFWQNLPLGAPFLIAFGSVFGIAAGAVFLTRKKLDWIGHWATVALVAGLCLGLLPAFEAARWAVLGLAAWMFWRRWRIVRI